MHPPTRRASLVPLLALNGLLVATLAAVTLGRPTEAQGGRAGDYVLVAMNTQVRSGESLAVIDTANRRLSVVAWENAQNELVPLGTRDLNNDARERTRGRIVR